jgi:hypothetical protein
MPVNGHQLEYSYDEGTDVFVDQDIPARGAKAQA